MRIAFLLLFSLFFTGIGFAQKYDKAYLQEQNRKIQADIQRLNKILADTKKESKNSLVYVVALDDKINSREEYINNTRKENKFIEDDIYLKQLEINKYRRELAELRKDFGEVLVNAYKNKKGQDKLMFVLGSKDLSQAIRRIKYLQLYSDYQDDKAQDIKNKIADIEKLKASREKDIQDKKRLLARQEAEIQTLERERLEKNKVVQEYKKNEKQIVADIRKKQAEQDKLDAQIQLAIAEEIRIQREKEAALRAKLEAERKEKERLANLEAERKRAEEAAKDANRVANKATRKVETKPAPVVTERPAEVVIPKSDYAKLSESFASNQGKLPNPLPGSMVVSHYGRHEHPLIPGLMVNNKGVDLSGPANSVVKSVFNGTVTSVFKHDGNLIAVIVNHGEYSSVYTKIDDVFVKKGDVIKTGQDIGHVFVNENNRAVTNVMIYKDKNIQNPENWIRLY